MLNQSEADRLIAIQKKRVKEERYNFPLAGERLVIPIISTDEREPFLIDINRRRIKLTKCTYQNRYQGTIILVRLDVDGSPHPNPEVVNVPLTYLEPYNGQTILCPHLHLYVEGFDDKWAIPSPSGKFSRTKNIRATLDDFFYYCNVTEIPEVQGGLF
ncbi:MAG: hypothetical protein HY769_00620 [Candidatus Stahlbacteria bacterium]|nr:hypothetical protein [Candidatus Stahlbacteria bacterium]